MGTKSNLLTICGILSGALKLPWHKYPDSSDSVEFRMAIPHKSGNLPGWADFRACFDWFFELISVLHKPVEISLWDDICNPPSEQERRDIKPLLKFCQKNRIKIINKHHKKRRANHV